MARKAVRRREQGAGTVRQLPSGRWQARYRDDQGVMKAAPTTFDTKLDATTWLDDHTAGVTVEARPVVIFGPYAESWLATRELKPRSREEYRRTLATHILPAFEAARLDAISPARVRAWYATLDPERRTARAHAYGLLRTILATAVADDLIDANPCRIRGAGTARTQHAPRPATLAELTAIHDAMPDRYKAAVLMAAWLGLRFGELTELRRSDVDLAAKVVRVRRAVTRVGSEFVVGTPKSRAGIRDVAIPPHLVPTIQSHLDRHVAEDPGALLFPARGGGHMAPSSLFRVFYPARDKAGRPDLRWHDLRHTGATLAAATGATLAELMARLGHSTPQAALIYQHAAADRDRAIADALSEMAGAKVVPLRRRKARRKAAG